MEIRVLADNNTLINEYCIGEPGASYYIEADGLKLLLDTGYSDVYIKNAERLGIDLSAVTHIVLSHGHDDHTRGLKFLDKSILNSAEIIAHPDCFLKKRKGELNIGAPEGVVDSFIAAKEPYKISENIVFLGEIPQTTSFETRRAIGERFSNGAWETDYITEDSAIAITTEDGLFIVTGCSHCGIGNIVEYAKKVCGDDRIAGIIGGFHLRELDERALDTVKYLVDAAPKKLYPCHCTCLKVKAEFCKYFDIEEVGCGTKITF